MSERPSTRLFSFACSSTGRASVTCLNCGWHVYRRTRDPQAVYDLSEDHVCARGGPQPPDPDALGRIVRQVWVAWALQQPDPKPSWLLPWEELDEGQREVDRLIGLALYQHGAATAWDLSRILRAGERQ